MDDLGETSAERAALLRRIARLLQRQVAQRLTALGFRPVGDTGLFQPPDEEGYRPFTGAPGDTPVGVARRTIRAGETITVQIAFTPQGLVFYPTEDCPVSFFDPATQQAVNAAYRQPRN